MFRVLKVLSLIPDAAERRRRKERRREGGDAQLSDVGLSGTNWSCVSL